MKKILILTSSVPKDKRDDNWQGFAKKIQLAQNNGSQASFEVWALSELGYLADGQESKIWKKETGQDLKEFDMIVIRDAGKNREFAQSVAWYAKLNNIVFIDRFWQKSLSGNKLAYAFFRAINGTPSPTTLSATSPIKLLNLFKALSKDSEFKLSFPLVCKALDARKGNLNFLANNLEDLRLVLKDPENQDVRFILQPMIPNLGDFRVLVIGGTAELAIFRSGDKSKTHLNNSSKGAETRLICAEDIPEEVRRLAERTAVKEKLSVAGVDIIENSEAGELFVLELNASPQLQSGAFVDEKIAAYANGLVRIVEREAGKTKLKADEASAAGNRFTIIGRREKVGVLESGQELNAKIDSGAYYCSLHVHEINEEDKVLTVHFDGGVVKEFSNYRKILVSPSSGNKEWRFVVPLTLQLAEKEIVEDISLTSRGGMRYRFLIGRRLMRKGKFLINPAKSYYFGKANNIKLNGADANAVVEDTNLKEKKG
jgi:glutathione synthase/RimK-type ligase-like ATP-grasp enzyme